jgi:2-methylcitrate dehydratase PrpD
MALAGADTAALGTYSDENAVDPRYVAIRERIKLDPKPVELKHKHGAGVTMELSDGRVLETSTNVGIPASDIEGQEQKLVAKFHALAEPVIGRQRTKAAIGQILRFEQLPNLKALMESVA